MKILFVHQSLVSFVEKDLNILRLAHQVRNLHYRGLQDIPSLVKGTIWADLTFSWFGKLHAFFAVLFSKMLDKKSVVVAGGDDVAHEPEINYGMFSFWWKKWCPLFVFKYADLILSVSDFNRRETIENARANTAMVKLLYHGFDDKKWRPLDGVAKQTMVLTVGTVSDETYMKKGLKLFVQCAKYLPDAPFLLVGLWKDGTVDRLKAIASSNVNFTGGLYGEDLVRIYSRAKVYVQISVHESFGCSLAEAMLCECVPVVARRAALPEVVGDCGFHVDEPTPKAVATQIEKALASDLGDKARRRIMRHFPLEKRRKALLAAIDEVMRK